MRIIFEKQFLGCGQTYEFEIDFEFCDGSRPLDRHGTTRKLRDVALSISELARGEGTALDGELISVLDWCGLRESCQAFKPHPPTKVIKSSRVHTHPFIGVWTGLSPCPKRQSKLGLDWIPSQPSRKHSVGSFGKLAPVARSLLGLGDLPQPGFGTPLVTMTDSIKYGSSNVPLIRREWPLVTGKPYRKTYSMKPGDPWYEAPVTEDQWETYVEDGDGYIPVGAKIARELIEEGASEAGFIELWGGCVVVDHNLVCIEPAGLLREVLDRVLENNQGRLRGFPDVYGIFPDGRIALREAKCADTKDRLSRAQHDLSDLLRRLYPEVLVLAVVEWRSPMP